jgi:hypothetical protein
VELVDCVQGSASPWAIAGYWHWIGRDSLIWPRCDGLIWPHL